MVIKEVPQHCPKKLRGFRVNGDTLTKDCMPTMLNGPQRDILFSPRLKFTIHFNTEQLVLSKCPLINYVTGKMFIK